jgi:Regulator of chromosome condensation (RCC1) repeat
LPRASFRLLTKAWGRSSQGETDVPSGLTGVVDVAGGLNHSLALKSDGTVVAWGDNFYGQADVPSGLTDVVDVAAGQYHNLALKSDGTVVAWGNNDFGGQTNVPSGLAGVVAVDAGGYHSLALKSDGTVVVWGDNSFGQTNVPSGLTGVVAVDAGHVHSLAVKQVAELGPTSKADCKNGGHAKYGFKNQGQCIKAVSTAPPPLNTEIATPCPTDPVDSGEQVTWDIETTPAGLNYQWRLAYETLEDENNVFAWRDPRSSNEPLVYNSAAGPHGGFFRLDVRAVAADGSVDQTPATCRYWVNPSQPPATEGKVVTGSITPWHEQVTFPLIEGNDITFTWQVTGYYDLVQARLHRVNSDNTLTDVTPWEECTSLTKTYTDLPDGNYRLSIAVVQYERSNAQTFTHFRVDSIG